MPLCCVIIPRHHAAPLFSIDIEPSSFWGRLALIEEAADRAANNSERCISSINSNTAQTVLPKQHRHYELLVLQCHSDGVIWRGLLPLFSMTTSVKSPEAEVSKSSHASVMHKCENDNDGHYHCGTSKTKSQCRRKKESMMVASRASSILMNHFQNCICRIEVELPIDAINNVADYDHGAKDADSSKRETTDIISSYDKSFHYFTTTASSESYYNDDESNTSHHSNCNNNNIPTILLLLPPNSSQQQQKGHGDSHYYSRTPSTRPTNPFALRLIHFENTFIRLTSLSAYISTLGGGFFLCRYLSTAISLARKQLAIAIIRGDTDMALKCRINEGYCYIHSGKLNRGKRVIRRVLKDVTGMQMEKGGRAMGLLLDYESEDGLLNHTPERELSELTVIKNMCLYALRFANLINSKGVVMKVDNRIVSSTHDDFQRIRIVKDRKWR